jgi:hypothetical protein
MARANLDPTVTIEPENRHCYHLRVETRIIDPRDRTHPIVKKRILCLRPIDYKKYFECSARDAAEYLKVMNIENCELVHDPTREELIKVEIPKSAEEEFLITKKMGEALRTPAERRKQTKKVTK